jgi:DNA-binding CsgD family transcriptional regulator/PAS domain-containing protein
MNEHLVAQVMDDIYSAALAPAHVPAMLSGLGRVFRSHFADSYTRTEDYTRHYGVAVGLDPADYQDEFLGVWSRRNVWGKKHPVRLAGEIVTTGQMVPKRDLLRSEMYNEYLHPRGLHEGLRLAIRAGDGAIEDISLLRPWSAGPFEGEDIRLASMLLPHLQRGAAVARRLRQADAIAETGLAALDSVPHAVFLLNGSGRVLRMNSAAEAMAADHDGLEVTAAGLAPTDVAASAALNCLVLQAAGAAAEPRTSGSLRLRRRSGRPDLVAIAHPTGQPAGWGLTDPRGVLVIASDPAARSVADAKQLQALYALTPAEATVALDLLAGRDVSEIARHRGRSVATIRTQLGRLLEKTGTTRQVDLVRLLLRLPLPGRPDTWTTPPRGD